MSHPSSPSPLSLPLPLPLPLPSSLPPPLPLPLPLPLPFFLSFRAQPGSPTGVLCLLGWKRGTCFPPLPLPLPFFLSFRAQRGTCFPPASPQICHPERSDCAVCNRAAEEPVLSEAEGPRNPQHHPKPLKPSNHRHALSSNLKASHLQPVQKPFLCSHLPHPKNYFPQKQPKIPMSSPKTTKPASSLTIRVAYYPHPARYNRNSTQISHLTSQICKPNPNPWTPELESWEHKKRAVGRP